MRIRFKELNNKKMQKVNWCALGGWILYTIGLSIIPNISWIPWYVFILYTGVWAASIFCFFLFLEDNLRERVEKLSNELDAKCWMKEAESLLPEIYLFDLTQGYIYGLFALNPFYIQKVDLKEVEDVEVVISDIKGYITTSVICRIIWKRGKNDIYIQRHRKYHPLTWGCEEDKAYRESAEKLKEAILKLKIVAEARAEE